MTPPEGRAAPTGGLARCVADVEGFLAGQWGRVAVHRSASDPDAFADLFSLETVDRLVSSSFARLPAFRLVRDGSPVPAARYTRTARLGGEAVAGVGDAGRVWDEFSSGATIVLQGLQRYWPPLARFCRQLEVELTHPVQANAYVTPAGSQGLAVHYDTHDVFVLQVAGSKEWSVHPPVLDDPLPSQPWASHKADPPPPSLAVDLRAGDSLYMPRGFLHSARAQRDLSAHLTIGVLSQTWHDVARAVVALTADNVEFRRSLPAGFAHDEETFAKGVDAMIGDLRRWLDTVDTRDVSARFVRRFWSSRAALWGGHLDRLLSLEQLVDTTPVRRRDGSICHVWTDGAVLHVLLGERSLQMPAALETLVRRIADTAGRPFAPADLSDLADEPSRLVLVRRLVREGLLEPAGFSG